jgi:predicted transcriptional regulator
MAGTGTNAASALAKSLRIAQNPPAADVHRAVTPMRLTLRALTRHPQSSAPRSRRHRTAAQAFRAGGPVLGPLETKLLELLWKQRCSHTVRQMHSAFPGLAYTTVMTTLDRLYRKGLLLRYKHGRAFAYEPRCARDELLGELISGHVTDLLGASEDGTVILSTLVRAVGQTDLALLDELDTLVQAERSRLKEPDK